MNNEVEIILADGYKFKAKVNANTFYPETKVSDKELTDTNLVSITIDGRTYENMTVTAHDDEVLCFRQYSFEELERQKLDAKIQYLAMMQGVTL